MGEGCVPILYDLLFYFKGLLPQRAPPPCRSRALILGQRDRYPRAKSACKDFLAEAQAWSTAVIVIETSGVSSLVSMR